MKFRSSDGQPRRLASTKGHIIIVGKEWVEVPEFMHRQALAAGCYSEEMFQQIKEEVTVPVVDTPPVVTVPDADKTETEGNVIIEPPKKVDPAQAENDKRVAVVVERMATMLDGGEEGHFTKKGLPNRTALNKLCGFDVVDADFQKAWDVVKPKTDEG